MSTTTLNTGNIMKKVYDPDEQAITVTGSLDITPTPGAATEAEQEAQTVLIQELVDKTEAGLVTEPHDYREITYVGATTAINTVVYRMGGAAGTIVATITLGYDGSTPPRLTSVTKS